MGATNPSSIVEVAARLALSLEPAEVCATAAGAIGEAMGSAACALYCYAPTHDLVTLKAAWSSDDDSDVALLVGVAFPLADRVSLRQAIRERRMVETHVNDPGLSAAERDEMWGELTVLVAPLVFRGEVIGALAHAEKRLRHITRQERHCFEQLAAVAALALGNARLFARQQDHNRHLAALLEASRAVSSTVVLDEVLSLLARKAADALSIVRCRVYEFDEVSGALAERTGYVAPRGGELPAAPDIDDPSSVVRRALDTGEVQTERLVLPAVSGRGRVLRREVPEQYLTRVVVPIVFGGTPLGAMAFLESHGEREFSATEIELARALAEQAGAAIQNAHLFATLKQQATTDGLTGLPNHRFFYDRLDSEVARARRYGSPLSLLMIDIDDFKRFNDTYGHQAGDEALHSLAGILRGQLRRGVDIPARYGGEEFAVILPNTALGGAMVVGERLACGVSGAGQGTASALQSPEGRSSGESALCVGERLRRCVEEQTTAPGPASLLEGITVSVGATQLVDGVEVAGLVAAADTALYKAKDLGKNRVCVG
jgi:diguanylate cyclase (GGDEF)-like protein